VRRANADIEFDTLESAASIATCKIVGNARLGAEEAHDSWRALPCSVGGESR
jgi:hypothetical protein